MIFPAPIVAFVVICWRYLKKADSSAAFESTDTDLHAIDFLMIWSWELSSPCNSSSKFWCKQFLRQIFWIPKTKCSCYVLHFLTLQGTCSYQLWSSQIYNLVNIQCLLSCFHGFKAQSWATDQIHSNFQCRQRKESTHLQHYRTNLQIVTSTINSNRPGLLNCEFRYYQ